MISLYLILMTLQLFGLADDMMVFLAKLADTTRFRPPKVEGFAGKLIVYCVQLLVIVLYTVTVRVVPGDAYLRFSCDESPEAYRCEEAIDLRRREIGRRLFACWRVV